MLSGENAGKNVGTPIWKSFAVSERIEEEAGKKIVKRIPGKKA